MPKSLQPLISREPKEELQPRQMPGCKAVTRPEIFKTSCVLGRDGTWDSFPEMPLLKEELLFRGGHIAAPVLFRHATAIG
jgi:hypothetical protein